jgi:hypothetical protein
VWCTDYNFSACSPSSAAMARTKMTAKKSNGGSAPRVLLKASRTRVSGGQGQRKKASSTTKGTLPVGGGDLEKSFVHNEVRLACVFFLFYLLIYFVFQFCIICRDGAERSEENTLFMCALCPRVVCKMCLQLPPDILTKVLQEDISFRCICCHIKMEQCGAYFVSLFDFLLICSQLIDNLITGFL